MNDFKAAMLNYQDRVRESFYKQGMMVHMGAEVSEVRPGFCEVQLPNGLQVLQQHGLFHGGAIAAIVDVAGGYAAYSLFDEDDGILTVEFNVNFIAPARDGELTATSRVLSAGRRVIVGDMQVTDHRQKLIASGLGTCLVIQQQP